METTNNTKNTDIECPYFVFLYQMSENFRLLIEERSCEYNCVSAPLFVCIVQTSLDRTSSGRTVVRTYFVASSVLANCGGKTNFHPLRAIATTRIVMNVPSRIEMLTTTAATMPRVRPRITIAM